MSFVSDFLGDITGAGAMDDAVGIQREQFDYFKGLSEKDRADLMSIYDQADSEGFFDWQKRLALWDKSVDPTNERDLANIGGALRRAGARPGDTKTDATIAMAVNAQKKQRGEASLKFFEDAFKDRFAVRSAIAGNNGPLMSHAGDTLSQTLMGLGQQQQQVFSNFSGLVAPQIFGGGGGMPGMVGGGGGGTPPTGGSLGNIGGRAPTGPGGTAQPTGGTMKSPGAQQAFQPSFFADTQRWLS